MCIKFEKFGYMFIQIPQFLYLKSVTHPRSAMMQRFNPFKTEFTIVIFIHYKPRIAVAILDL